MNLVKYPDGTSYINSTKLGQQVFRINSYEDLWHLNQFVDAFVDEHKTTTSTIKPNIIIPNLIDAQADRRFKKGESSGLKLVCEFLNNLNANFQVFHPHNAEVVEALMDNVEILDNFFFIKSVLAQIENKDNLILMSSDAGGFKPLMKLCDKLEWTGETFSASKARSWDEVDGTKFVQQIDRQDFEGKDVLIIDDISVYGGTFKGLSKLLRERNVGKLYLAVSHMTVQDLGNAPTVTDFYDKMFTTNSKFDNYYVRGKAGGYQPDNLEIINLF